MGTNRDDNHHLLPAPPNEQFKPLIRSPTFVAQQAGYKTVHSDITDPDDILPNTTVSLSYLFLALKAFWVAGTSLVQEHVVPARGLVSSTGLDIS